MTLYSEQEKILGILKEAQSMPFLFIGSGVSLRYFSSFNWEGLLRHFASLVDPDDLSFERFQSRARQQLTDAGKALTKNSTSTAVADLIESEFNELWFKDARFSESRRAARDHVMKGASPFKIEIANIFSQIKIEDIPEKWNEEIDLLRKIGKKSIAGIITTNYDPFSNLIYSDYNTYIGQEELIFSQTLGVSEIYKIHGCSSSPSSIVINSFDYQDFDKKNAYLAAKLMTLFVEHPIIFLGYSLEDENIQAIIKSIVDCLSETNLEKIKNRFIFVEWKRDQTAIELSTHSRDFGNGKSINMTKVVTDSYVDLFRVILENKSKYPTKLLRKLKNDIYSLALTSDSPEKIVVMPMSEQQMDSEEIEVVIGFGIVELGKQGYKGISAEQVFMDIVFDNQNFNINMLVSETLPVLLKQVAFSLPVYKYISLLDNDDLPETLKPFTDYGFDRLANKTILQNRRTFDFKSVDDAIAAGRGDFKREVCLLQYVPEEYMDAQKLQAFLQKALTENPSILIGQDQLLKTYMKKLIKMLDYKKYKK